MQPQLRYPTATSVRPVIRPSLQGMSTTQSVIQHAVKQKSPQTTPSSAPCVSTASSSAGIGELIQEPAKCVKQCKAFLSELIKLSVSRPQSTAHHVKSLIQGLIDGTVKPEEFMQKMQIVLKLSYQPQIVSILKKSLPPLRQSMLSNYTHIEGVRAPPASTVSANVISDGNDSTRPLSTTYKVIRPTSSEQQAQQMNMQQLLHRSIAPTRKELFTKPEPEKLLIKPRPLGQLPEPMRKRQLLSSHPA